jgi:hypothetical protein
MSISLAASKLTFDGGRLNKAEPAGLMEYRLAALTGGPAGRDLLYLMIRF